MSREKTTDRKKLHGVRDSTLDLHLQDKIPGARTPLMYHCSSTAPRSNLDYTLSLYLDLSNDLEAAKLCVLTPRTIAIIVLTAFRRTSAGLQANR
jgi:hypothetical protein